MTEKMLKDALQEVKLSDDKKREILKKVKMQKGQKVSYGRRKKLAIATVGFACVICVGLFYSMDHLTVKNPSGEKEEIQMPTEGENTDAADPVEENEENVAVAEELVVWNVKHINGKKVVLSKCKKVGVVEGSGNTIYEAEEEEQTYEFSKDCVFELINSGFINRDSEIEGAVPVEVSRKEFCDYMRKEMSEVASFWEEQGETICMPLVLITMKEGEIVRIEEVYVA